MLFVLFGHSIRIIKSDHPIWGFKRRQTSNHHHSSFVLTCEYLRHGEHWLTVWHTVSGSPGKSNRALGSQPLTGNRSHTGLLSSSTFCWSFVQCLKIFYSLVGYRLYIRYTICSVNQYLPEAPSLLASGHVWIVMFLCLRNVQNFMANMQELAYPHINWVTSVTVGPWGYSTARRKWAYW